MITKEELIARAERPGKDAMKLHPFYKGKVQVVSKCCIRSFDDFAVWYTPGVAKPCLDIKEHPEKVFEHTNKANTVGVISDGTRVLGLGDIGPEAGLPVMEGKALLFKYLGGIDVYPLCLDTKDPDEIISTALFLQPSLGGINLEDIAQPKCFYILNTLREKARIPVWHDDQQGTATVTVAGFINALRLVRKQVEEVRVVMVGAGSSNIRIAWLLISAGVKPANIVMADSKGILHKGRTELKEKFKEKWELCQVTNERQLKGEVSNAFVKSDVCIALSTPGPGVVKQEWVASMNKDSVVFACANPIPEMWPWDAKEAGAKIVATGRSDFPNQVNNSLGFPGIFRGTLDVRARTITDEMCIAAAHELAQCAVDKGVHEEHLLPTMDEWEVFPREAVAVAMKAQQQGVAGTHYSSRELFEKASTRIKEARQLTRNMMDTGFIKVPSKYLTLGE